MNGHTTRAARLRIPAFALPFLGFSVVAVALTAIPVDAASGDLDPTFGNGGIRTPELGLESRATAVAVQSDGRIVAAGHSLSIDSPRKMSIVRLDSSGTPDASFGVDGVVRIESPAATAASALAIEPDDDILVSGGRGTPSGNWDFLLARLIAGDGSLDSTFGSGGIVVTPAENIDGRTTLALQSDGKILLGGSAKRSLGAPPLGKRDFLIARYDPNGAPDSTFDRDGSAIRSMLGRWAAVTGLAVRPDGRILAAGPVGNVGKSRFAITRLGDDGRTDRSFARRGRFRQRLVTKVESAEGVVLLPGGGLIAAGFSFVPGSGFSASMTLVQLDASGDFDPSFGDGGIATFAPDPGAFHTVFDMARQPDGKILVVGALKSAVHEPSRILVARFLDDGTPDPSFGTGGVVTTPVGEESEAHAVALQSDGSIVVAGHAVIDDRSSFVLVRYLP